MGTEGSASMGLRREPFTRRRNKNGIYEPTLGAQHATLSRPDRRH